MYVESPSATKILLKFEMLWVKTFQIAKINTDKTSVTRVIPKNHSLLNLRFSRHKRLSRSRPDATFLTSVTWRTSAASYVLKTPCSTLSILHRRFKFHARRELSWGRFYNLDVGRKPSPEETVCFNTKRQQDPAVMSDPPSLSLYKTGPCALGTTILSIIYFSR